MCLRVPHGSRRDREGEYDKVVADARESKPEGSRVKVQRRKPPSAKAPKSEGCWSSSKLDCYLHRMRACSPRNVSVDFLGGLSRSLDLPSVAQIKGPGYIMPHNPSSAHIVPGIPYAPLIMDWPDELHRNSRLRLPPEHARRDARLASTRDWI